jgi:hypothetical protein
MALGSTQPLTEMSTRDLSWGGKGGRCVGLTTLPPSCLKTWEPRHPGALSAFLGLYGTALPLLTLPCQGTPPMLHHLHIKVLLSSGGHASKAWEPSNKAMFFRISRSIEQKSMCILIETSVFWDVTLSGLVASYPHFGGTYCLHLQSIEMNFLFDLKMHLKSVISMPSCLL